MAKRILSIFMALCMAAAPVLLSSCGGSAGTAATTAAGGEVSTEATTVSESDARAQFDPKFDKVDMGGYTFRIGSRDDDTHGYPLHTRDLFAEGETGDIINDAVYLRNRTVEEMFNCKIELTAYGETKNENEVLDVVKKSFMAGDNTFDLALCHMINGALATANGYFYNLAEFPNIDLSKPYWAKNVTEGLSIGHKLYIGLSDLAFSSNEALYCIFFNKKLCKDYQVEDPYTLVENNQWTFDKFAEIIKTGTADLDGDTKMTKADQYGYVNSNALNFLWSGGSHIDTKDADDIPHMDFMTDKTTEIFNKAFEIVNNAYTYKALEWFDKDAAQIFVDGRGVFYSSQLCRVNDLRASEFDFGIVPYPKFDANQPEFYTYMDGHASMMTIPQLLPHPEWTGMIIEQLSYLSYKDILPAYYDVVLNIKMVRDQKSIDMLDILFRSKVVDFGYAYGNWDAWMVFISNIHNNNRDLVSAYQKQEGKALKALEQIITKVSAL